MKKELRSYRVEAELRTTLLWHTTKRENLTSILRDGFREAACINKRLTSVIQLPPGVWVGDIPAIDDELFDGVGLFDFDAESQSFIEVRADASILHHAKERMDSTWPGKQWLVPAAALNVYPRREVSMDEVLQIRIKKMRRGDLAEWVKDDRGYAMEFVERVRSALAPRE